MTFTSLSFLLFLPTVLALYWLLRQPQWQNLLLVVASYLFYAMWDWRFCFLMLTPSLIDYGIGLGLRRTERENLRKGLLLATLVSNLGVLAVFKYFNFFLDNFRQVGELLGLNVSTGTLEIVLPVGISFYTFQNLSYTIDAYRRKVEPTRNLIDYLAFVSFFPQMLAGPIERASQLLPQFQQPRTLRWNEFACGCRRILWGFFKKIVIADSIAQVVVAAYADPASVSGPRLVLATVLFAMQIYCDFSAYSDIAIGTAHLFGIRLMQNFAYPYFSQSIREFWQRWHISLSTWFRDYVYIPLGGGRTTALKRSRNILLTFLVSGLWHGAAWQFLAWGGMHGLALIGLKQVHKPQDDFRLEQPGGDRLVPTPRVAARMLATFTTVCLFWVFFRANSFSDALLIWQKMAFDLLNLPAWRQIWQEYAAGGPLFYMLNITAAFVLVEWIHRHMPYPLLISHWPTPARWAAYALVFWFVAEYADTVTPSPFIYFQF